jgi:hypothetical protein
MREKPVKKPSWGRALQGMWRLLNIWWENTKDNRKEGESL